MLSINLNALVHTHNEGLPSPAYHFRSNTCTRIDDTFLHILPCCWDVSVHNILDHSPEKEIKRCQVRRTSRNFMKKIFPILLTSFLKMIILSISYIELFSADLNFLFLIATVAYLPLPLHPIIHVFLSFLSLKASLESFIRLYTIAVLN